VSENIMISVVTAKKILTQNLEMLVILSNSVEADGGVNAVGGCVEPVP
jgi:hypothetical protein